MSESLPEATVLAPGSAALIVVGLLTVGAIARGVARMIRAAVVVAAGFAAGTVAWLNVPDLVGGVIDPVTDGMLVTASVIAGLAAATLTSILWNKLFAPGDPGGSSRVGFGKALAVSLLPAAFFLWSGGTLTRLIAAASSVAQADSGGERPGWLERLERPLRTGVTGRFLDATDPFTEQGTAKLCEILVGYRVQEFRGHVNPRPDLRPVVSHPEFQRLLNDREIKRAIAGRDYARLLTMPEVRRTARHREIKSALAGVQPFEVRRAVRVD